MKYDIKKKTKSIVTVQRAWELNFKKEPKPTRQHIITIVKRFQETGSLLPRPKKKENGSYTKNSCPKYNE